MSEKSISEIVERIRALRAKAADDGATEAEAMQAAALAAKLLSKHNIAEADLRDKKEDMKAETVGASNYTSRLPYITRFVFSQIEKLTETKAYSSSGQMKFIGVGADPEMAIYLYELILGASEREWKRFWATEKNKPVHKEQASRSYTNYVKRGFIAGFGYRISQRLAEMVKEKQAAYAKQVKDTAAGTALVIKKQDLIKQEELSLNLRPAPKTRHRERSKIGNLAGVAAGDKVNLGRPLGSDNDRSEMLR